MDRGLPSSNAGRPSAVVKQRGGVLASAGATISRRSYRESSRRHGFVVEQVASGSVRPMRGSQVPSPRQVAVCGRRRPTGGDGRDEQEQEGRAPSVAMRFDSSDAFRFAAAAADDDDVEDDSAPSAVAFQASSFAVCKPSRRRNEWVAMDCRDVSHSVPVLVGTGRARRCFATEKASKRIGLADVNAALPSPGLYARAREAAPA